MDWKSQLNAIIEQTERNLDSRRDYIKRSSPPRPATQLAASGNAFGNTTFQGLSSQQLPVPPPAAPMAPPIAGLGLGLGMAMPPAMGAAAFSRDDELDELRMQTGGLKDSFHKVLESVKFELDVRSNLSQKQLEAVREEVHAALTTSERQLLEANKELEIGVQNKIVAEREARLGSDVAMEAIKQTVANAQQETHQTLGNFQEAVLEQRETVRRIERELLAFKLDVESKLQEEHKRITGLEKSSKTMQAEVDHNLQNDTGQRLKEVESALLKEREIRKMVEAEVSTLKSQRGVIQGELENRLLEVRNELLDAGSFGSVDDKVKECGRLIVRMGTELMEETKRRQRLEDDLQELRVRLANMEAYQHMPMQASHQHVNAAADAVAAAAGAAASGKATMPTGCARLTQDGLEAAVSQLLGSSQPSAPSAQTNAPAEGLTALGGGSGGMTSAMEQATILAAGRNAMPRLGVGPTPGPAVGVGPAAGPQGPSAMPLPATWSSTADTAIDARVRAIMTEGEGAGPGGGHGGEAGSTTMADNSKHVAMLPAAGVGASSLANSNLDDRVREILNRGQATIPGTAVGTVSGTAGGTARGPQTGGIGVGGGGGGVTDDVGTRSGTNASSGIGANSGMSKSVRMMSREQLDARVHEILGRLPAGGTSGTNTLESTAN